MRDETTRSAFGNHLRQREEEARPLVAAFRLNPDTAATVFNDSFDHRQSKACTGAFRIQFIKYPEYLVVVLMINPDAVVPDEKDRLPALLPKAKFNTGDTVITTILDRILDQIQVVLSVI